MSSDFLTDILLVFDGILPCLQCGKSGRMFQKICSQKTHIPFIDRLCIITFHTFLLSFHEKF